MALKGEVRFGVSAFLDRSVDVVFGNVEKRAQRARDAVNRTIGGMGRGAYRGLEAEAAAANKNISSAVDRSLREQARAIWAVARMREREERRAAAEHARLERQRVRETEKAAREQARAEAQAARERARVAAQAAREQEKAARDRAKEEARVAREQARQEAYWARARHQSALRRMREEERELARADAERRNFAYRVGFHGITRYAPGVLHRGARVAGDILRGAGLDMSLYGSVHRVVSLEAEAVRLSNMAYGSAVMTGVQGKYGKRIAPDEFKNAVREAALRYGVSSQTAMEGLHEYTALSGDVQTAMLAMPKLLQIAKFSATDPRDIFRTAGNVAAGRWEDPAKTAEEAAQRAEDIATAVNIGAASGFLGTIEMEHLARYGPKLASAANQINVEPNQAIADMFALAQVAIKGGASSAAQATTSVAAMMNTLETPARREQFRAFFKRAGEKDPLFREMFGTDFSLEDETGRFRSIQDIIIASIVAADKDTEGFKKMWMNVQGARNVKGLRNIYLKAGGGEEGVAEVRRWFAKFGTVFDEKTMEESVAASKGTAGSKVAVFQERLDAVTERMLGRVLPALEKLEEPAIKVANAFADMVSWAAQNPIKATAMAFFAGVLRAAAESIMRLMIERSIAGGPRGGAPGGPIIFGGGGGNVRSGRLPSGGGTIRQRATAFLAPAGGVGGTALALGGGAIGGFAGISMAQALGLNNSSWGGVLGQIGGGALGGLMNGGPLGALLGTVVAAGSVVHGSIKSMGGLDPVIAGVREFLRGGDFFKGYDFEMNQKARAEAKKRARLQQSAVPTQVKADVDHTPVVRAIQELGARTQRVEVVNMPEVGSALAPPVVSDLGRQPRQ